MISLFARTATGSYEGDIGEILEKRCVSESGFPRTSRLLSARDYSPVFKKPDTRVSNPQLLILARHNTHHCSRLGLVVAKKNARLAVQRNRIKRIIRESFRARKAEFGTIDLVVLTRPKLDKRSNQEIRQLSDVLFDELLKKISSPR